MKTIFASLLCPLLCLLPAFFSCTKTADRANPSVDPSGTFAAKQTAGLSLLTVGDSLVIQGDTGKGDQTALIQTAFLDNNVNNFVSFTALGAGLSGNGGIDRALMKFSLRMLSDSGGNYASKIKKAVLYLYQYHRPADQDPYAIEQTGDNSVELHRIVSDWQANTVTWNTQPKLAKGSADTLQDVVVIPAVATPLPLGANDNQAVDVTGLVQRMIKSRNEEGFLMKLSPKGENKYYTGRAYGSFACPIVAKRPRLVIYF